MSRRSSGKLLLVLAFFLTLAAGILVGVGMSERAHGGDVAVNPTSTRPAAPERSWLSDQLKLTPQQRDQMRSIWQDASQGQAKTLGDRRHALSKERDDAMLALYTPEQKAERERIIKDYSAKIAEVSKERDKVMQSCVEKTKQILTEEQRRQYEAMLKDRADHGDRPDRGDRDRSTGGWPPHRGGPGTRPSNGRPPTQPVL